MSKGKPAKTYRHSEWKRFREEVIRLDGGVCQRCGKGRADGKVLQVHHRHYKVGKAIWEYPHDACVTLCKGCHAAEHGIIRPPDGWELVGGDDLGDLVGTCEACSTSIRHVYFIQHLNWYPLEVGTVCCTRLTSSNEVLTLKGEMVRYAERRKRFVSSKRWRRGPADSWHIREDGLEVAVFSGAGGFRLVIEGIRGKSRFTSLLEAKIYLFENIQSGDIQDYVLRNKHRLAYRI